MRIKFIILLCLGTAMICADAQAQKVWRFGYFVQPQKSYLYNQADWTAHKEEGSYLSVPTQNSLLQVNSGATGVFIDYQWNESLGLRSGLSFSRQLQRFVGEGSIPPAINHPGEVDRHEYKVKTDYLRLPLRILWNSDPYRDVMMEVSLGSSINYLVGYEEQEILEARKYNLNLEDFFEYYYDRRIKGKEVVRELRLNFPDDPSISRDEIKTLDLVNRRYSSFVVAAEMTVGVRVRLSEELTLHAHLYGSYDLTNVDNLSSQTIPSDGESPSVNWNGLRFHNRNNYSLEDRPISRGIIGGIGVGISRTFTTRRW